MCFTICSSNGSSIKDKKDQHEKGDQNSQDYDFDDLDPTGFKLIFISDESEEINTKVKKERELELQIEDYDFDDFDNLDDLEDIFKMIVNKSGNKNPKDETGQTALHWAAANGQENICEMILDQIEEKNPKNQYGITPLHLAARNGHTNICNMIIHKSLAKSPEEERIKFLSMYWSIKKEQNRQNKLYGAGHFMGRKKYKSKRKGLMSIRNQVFVK